MKHCGKNVKKRYTQPHTWAHRTHASNRKSPVFSHVCVRVCFSKKTPLKTTVEILYSLLIRLFTHLSVCLICSWLSSDLCLDWLRLTWLYFSSLFTGAHTHVTQKITYKSLVCSFSFSRLAAARVFIFITFACACVFAFWLVSWSSCNAMGLFHVFGTIFFLLLLLRLISCQKLTINKQSSQPTRHKEIFEFKSVATKIRKGGFGAACRSRAWEPRRESRRYDSIIKTKNNSNTHSKSNKKTHVFYPFNAIVCAWVFESACALDMSVSLILLPLQSGSLFIPVFFLTLNFISWHSMVYY